MQPSTFSTCMFHMHGSRSTFKMSSRMQGSRRPVINCAEQHSTAALLVSRTGFFSMASVCMWVHVVTTVPSSLTRSTHQVCTLGERVLLHSHSVVEVPGRGEELRGAQIMSCGRNRLNIQEFSADCWNAACVLTTDVCKEKACLKVLSNYMQTLVSQTM
jgi:hypothetical protein